MRGISLDVCRLAPADEIFSSSCAFSVKSAMCPDSVCYLEWWVSLAPAELPSGFHRHEYNTRLSNPFYSCDMYNGQCSGESHHLFYVSGIKMRMKMLCMHVSCINRAIIHSNLRSFWRHSSYAKTEPTDSCNIFGMHSNIKFRSA